MLSCFDIARYFLALTDEESGDAISNLKLQKLVYYAQGFHLALHDEPLFGEKIEAWLHGPVIPDLYHYYKEHGSTPIPKPLDVDFSIYTDEVKELLDEVYTVYGQYSAWKLRELTHEEPTWKNNYQAFDKTISHPEMITYFKTLINDGQTKETAKYCQTKSN